MTEEPKKPLRSVSQLKQYEKCPHAYKLARIDRVEWRRPAAWLPQGTAVHAVLEEKERRAFTDEPMSLEEAQDMFRAEYTKDIGVLCADTPNFDWWFRSGPYRGEEDTTRRYHIGLEQIEKFYTWEKKNGNQVFWIAPAITDPRCAGDEAQVVNSEVSHVEDCGCQPETPGIELRFDIELDEIVVRGFIDAIVVEDGELRVRDYKTGATPGDDFQLGVYALAVAMKYGVEAPKLGDYYMAGKKGKPGKPTVPYDLTEWTQEAVTAKFRELEDNIQSGRFDPLPEPDKCKFCEVSYYCDSSMA